MGSKPQILFALLISLHTFCLVQTTTPTYYVSKSGNVTLNKDGNGFYANVDFVYNINEASDSSSYSYDPALGFMNLALYTNQTILTQSCLEFSQYFCSAYGCSEHSWMSSTPVLPEFEVETGYSATANVYLNYGHWELSSYATVADGCSNNTYSGYGTGRSGILGLGAGPSFLSSSVFSVNLARDGSSGYLLFSSDSDVTSTSEYVGSLTTDYEWNVAESDVEFEVGSSSVSAAVGVIFDLNSDTIGLSTTFYTNVIDAIKSEADISCNTDSYKPICTYNGKIGDLPTIKMTIKELEIDLPPTLYVLNQTDSDADVNEITLGFRSLSPSSTQSNNYVTSDYQYYIILGQNFMSYYHTEFSFVNKIYEVKLYNPYYTAATVWPYIVGGVLGFIVIVSIICCCVKKRRNRIRAQKAAQVQNNAVNTSDQVPLVTNAQANTNNEPQYYPPYNYQQANYGYPQQYQGQQQGNYGYNYMQPGQYYVPPAQGQLYTNESAQ